METGLYEYLIWNPGNIMGIATISMLILGCFLIFLNRKNIIDSFTGTSARTWFMVVGIVLFLGVLYGLTFQTFMPSDEEFEELYHAGQIVRGDLTVFHDERYGLVYPLLLSAGIRLFGFTDTAALILDILFKMLSSLLVFMAAKAFQKDNKPAIYSQLLFTAFILVTTRWNMGFPAAVTFFLLFFVWAMVLCLRYRTYSLLVFSGLTACLAGQTKPEYFVLIVPLLCWLVIFAARKTFSVWKIILFVFLILLFSAPFLIKNIQFREGYQSGWCGSTSQPFRGGDQQTYNLPVATQLDVLLKPLTNNRFSFNYLINDLGSFWNFWTRPWMLFLLLLAVLGSIIVAGGQKPFMITIWSAFILLSFVYLADCNYYDYRYAVGTYGPLSLLGGLGLCAIEQFFVTRKKSVSRRRPFVFLSRFFPLIVGGLIVIISTGGFLRYSLNLPHLYPDYLQYQRLRSIPEYVPFDSVIITVQRNETMILKFWGYRNVYSLSDMIGIPYFEDRSRFLSEAFLPLEQGTDSFFVKTGYCEGLDVLTEMCRWMENSYRLEKVVDLPDRTVLFLINTD